MSKTASRLAPPSNAQGSGSLKPVLCCAVVRLAVPLPRRAC
ncbi:hypothetical protein [Cypionkella psychrotolerans]|nr:hypothetical protein [Cypionkella psychrotolerans]